jgi:hypothetical protein
VPLLGSSMWLGIDSTHRYRMVYAGEASTRGNPGKRPSSSFGRPTLASRARYLCTLVKQSIMIQQVASRPSHRLATALAPVRSGLRLGAKFTRVNGKVVLGCDSEWYSLVLLVLPVLQ